MLRLSLICTVFLAACSSAPDPYEQFTAELTAGASCGDLYAIRNDVDPNDPAIPQMNADLRRIGCYSSTSIRQPAR